MDQDSLMHCSAFYHFQRRLTEFGIPSLSFDRLGCAQSTPRSFVGPPTSTQETLMVLQQLLHLLHFEAPFIVVGHGTGCEFAREFQRGNPNDCRALLMIDPGRA